jgi:Ca-activated chloride channel family protein
MDTSDLSHYAILDVPFDASQDEIRAAYHQAARKYHPDTNRALNSSDSFYKVQKAYDLLSSPNRRSEYDATLPEEEINNPGFAFKLFQSKNRIGLSKDPQLVYALIDISAKPTALKTYQRPLNLTLVLDRSTSMNGERMDMVKDNAIRLVKQLGPDDVISIITFSDRAEILLPPIRNTDVHVIQSKISRIQTGGATEIFQGLSAGVNQNRQNLRPSYLNHLILLTDGRTYGDEQNCLNLAKEAAEDGIGISGLGIGDEWNDKFLDELASISGGVCMYISAPNDLRKFLESKYRNLEQVYGEQVTFQLSSNDMTNLQYAFRIYPEPAPLLTESPIRVGNLQVATRLVVMLEFNVARVESRQKEINLGEGYVTLQVPTRVLPRVRMPLKVSCTVGLDGDSAQNMPAPIVHALSQLTLYRMQEKAQDELDKGDTVKASRHLQYLATHLLSRGQRDLANAVLKEADNIQKKKHFSEEGDKRIKYGTRSLLLPPGMENKEQ